MKIEKDGQADISHDIAYVSLELELIARLTATSKKRFKAY